MRGYDSIFQTSLPSLLGPDGHGAIFIGEPSRAVRSFGDGAPGTWEVLGRLGGDPLAFGEVPASSALPEGRLLVGVYNDVSVSDDGGVSWRAGRGAHGRYVAYGFAFVPEPDHAYGGAVLAGVFDAAFGRDSSATVYRSDDGGDSWHRSHRFNPSALGIENATKAVVAVTPDGTAWAGVTYKIGPSAPGRSAVAKSTDGGRTWQPAGYVGWDVNQLVPGPDGRLYAATPDGVWRTTVPVYAVADEGSPTASDLGVRVWPNPTGGAVTASVSLPARARVTITVHDGVGRVVAAVHDGVADDGQRFAIETASLAAGRYTVRVQAASGVVSAGLTVAR